MSRWRLALLAVLVGTATFSAPGLSGAQSGSGAQSNAKDDLAVQQKRMAQERTIPFCEYYDALVKSKKPLPNFDKGIQVPGSGGQKYSYTAQEVQDMIKDCPDVMDRVNRRNKARPVPE